MKIAIISDIHDNLINLQRFLNWCKNNKIEKIICCGDVANRETLNILANGFLKDIYLVMGNAELFEEEEIGKYKNIFYKGRVARFEIKGVQVGLCHEPFLIEKIKELGKCNIIFYGHTHIPWQETRENFIKINPGTLGGINQKATFAVWDVENKGLELKLLEEI